MLTEVATQSCLQSRLCHKKKLATFSSRAKQSEMVTSLEL